MNFNEYQKKAWKTAIYPDKEKNISYPALGIGGESGEVLEKVKKMLRDNKGKDNPEKKEEIIKELGDLLWYMAALCTALKINLNEVAEKNITKISSRKKRNQIHGTGDKR